MSSVTERIEVARLECQSIERELRHPLSREATADMRGRLQRLVRQIAMLTEAERQNPALPKQARRFK